jgi:hypothetical protein
MDNAIVEFIWKSYGNNSDWRMLVSNGMKGKISACYEKHELIIYLS